MSWRWKKNTGHVITQVRRRKNINKHNFDACRLSCLVSDDDTLTTLNLKHSMRTCFRRDFYPKTDGRLGCLHCAFETKLALSLSRRLLFAPGSASDVDKRRHLPRTYRRSVSLAPARSYITAPFRLRHERPANASACKVKADIFFLGKSKDISMCAFHYPLPLRIL